MGKLIVCGEEIEFDVANGQRFAEEDLAPAILYAEEYTEVLKYFSYKHLREEYQPISKRFHDVAVAFLADYCNGKVKSANQFTQGIQRLIEAKDALIRSLI